MTQLSTQAFSSSGRKRFILQVYDRLGQTLITTYTSDAPGGIVEGFVSRRYPNNTCGQMDFEAKASLLRIEAGSILATRYDTGTSVVPMHFGVVTSNPDGRSGKRGTYQVASGKELLERSYVSPTDNQRYLTEVDAAVWLRYFVEKYRHPALKYDAEHIASTGVMFSGSMPAARGRNLYETIESILKGVESITENDWGVDPEGYVTIRPPTGVKNHLKSSVIAQFGDITSDNVVTQATILVANQVSSGAIIGAGYDPSTIGYTYTHPENPAWRAERSFEIETRDGRPVIDVLTYGPHASFSFDASPSQWISSETGTIVGVPNVVQDGNPDTHAISGSDTEVSMAVQTPNYTSFVGIALMVDAAAGSYTAQLRITFTRPGGSSYRVRFDLGSLIGQGKVEARFIAPYPTDRTVASTHAAIFFSGSAAMTGLVKVYEFRGLEANTALLEEIARAQIRLPAIEVQEVTFAKGFQKNPDGTDGAAYGAYLLEEPVKTLNLVGEKGEDLGLSGDIAEIVDTFTVTEGMLSRVALGQPIRSAQVRAIQKMAAK